MSAIPQEAIDAAAREFHRTRRGHLSWDQIQESTRDYYRRQARIHLRGAAPAMRTRTLTDATAYARDVNDHIIQGDNGYAAGFHYALTFLDSLAEDADAREARP